MEKELLKLKKRITRTFNICGFRILPDNIGFLAEQLLSIDESERENWLTVVLNNIQIQGLETTNIERDALEKAINALNHVGLQEGESVFTLIDAFRVPRFNYNLQNKRFELDKEPRCILAKCSNKMKHLRQRYEMLLQKTLRHELFAPAIIEGGVSANLKIKKFKLLYAENLLATSFVKEAVILGYLTQLKEGKFFIEDPTGCVELDLSNAQYHAGFFCDGCFVLAEGIYNNGVLKVDGLGFPPAEPSTSSRAFFGTQNSWGGESKKLLKYSTNLQELERTNKDATIVFLSDVRIDTPIVREKLRQLFVGYDACPPVAIVMMGPFSASNRNYNALRQHFDALGDLTAGCDQIKKHTDLIFIPSSEDPTAANILPRSSLPESLVAGLRKVCPRTLLASNPCRLQYCTQQIVVCRLDLMAKFCRNTLHFPPDTEKIDQHFARTLICQGHLAPFHPIAVPVYWDYDSSLWLYPLPDLIVIGDMCQSFTTTQHGCTILNTGSFVKSKFAFKVYMPATRTVEDSEIPEEQESLLE